MTGFEESPEHVIAATRNSLGRSGCAVCPFAGAPFAREQIRYTVSEQLAFPGIATLVFTSPLAT